MHVISSNGETTHLHLNSKHEKSVNKPQISLKNTSAEYFVAEVATLTKDTKFSYHDVVNIFRDNFICFYTIVTETSDTNRMSEPDELEINYFKMSFGKGLSMKITEVQEKFRILFRSEVMLMGDLDIP